MLATVTAGIYLGWRAPEIASPDARLQGFSFWTIAQFLINATLFVLIGLQLPQILDRLGGYSTGELLVDGAAISGVVIAVRIAWVFASTVVIRTLDRRPSQRARRADWRTRFLGSWVGMRGAVSLAAALAIPISTDAGEPFPARDLILFITFCVIMATLVVQGLTLPLVIRGLGLTDDGAAEREEEVHARLVATRAALERIDELSDEDWTRPDTLERLRNAYLFRKRRFAAQAGKIDDDGYEDQSVAYQRTLREVLDAQRRAVVELRNNGEISNEVMHHIERELDLEDSRLDVPRVPEARRTPDR